MLTVDWMGLVLGVGVLLLLLRGRWRLLRAAGALFFGDAGRAAATLLTKGSLTGVAVGGTFTHARGSPLAEAAGLWLGVLMAGAMGRRTMRDAALWALAASLIMWAFG